MSNLRQLYKTNNYNKIHDGYSEKDADDNSLSKRELKVQWSLNGEKKMNATAIKIKSFPPPYIRSILLICGTCSIKISKCEISALCPFFLRSSLFLLTMAKLISGIVSTYSPSAIT